MQAITTCGPRHWETSRENCCLRSLIPSVAHRASGHSRSPQFFLRGGALTFPRSAVGTPSPALEQFFYAALLV